MTLHTYAADETLSIPMDEHAGNVGPIHPNVLVIQPTWSSFRPPGTVLGGTQPPSSSNPRHPRMFHQHDRSIEYSLKDYSGCFYMNMKRKTYTGKTIYFSFEIGKVPEAIEHFIRLFNESNKPPIDLRRVIRKAYADLQETLIQERQAREERDRLTSTDGF